MNPQTNESIAYKSGSHQVLWKVKGWFRVAEISDDGSTFITGYDGMNLIPDSYDKDLVMLAIFKSGKLFQKYRLKELVQDFSKLKKTASHLYWGDYVGLDSEQNYVIKTAEGRVIKISTKTGRVVN